MRDLATEVRRIIADQLGHYVDKLEDDSRLVEDLGADSLDIVELVMEFEDEFDISIEDKEFDPKDPHTVGGIVAFLRGKGVKD